MLKAIIPVAGAGTTLRPHTHTQPKPLMPVAGKPILSHIVENLIQAGVHDFGFIIGYLGEKIEDFIRSRYSGKINMEFILQSPREGLGHAIWTARSAIRSADEILVVLGDTIIDADLSQFIGSQHSALGVQEVEDPRKFGVAVVDDGAVVSLAEKPNIPKSNLALVGLYKIKECDLLIEELKRLIREGRKGANNEYHLTDALMGMVRAGIRFQALNVDNWYDCGKKDSLLNTNRILLERLADTLPEYHYKNCVILPPVHIGEGCTIQDSIIGPNVAVAENATIKNSIVKNSILGAWSRLESIILNGSVIGNDASLTGHAQSVNIGDNTEIDFSS